MPKFMKLPTACVSALIIVIGPITSSQVTAQPAEVINGRVAPALVEPARLKLAEQTVAKLIPPGTYAKIMKDMMDSMAGGLIEQMMGMDAAVIAGVAGEEEGSEAAEVIKSKTMGDLAVERDPAFKERMDITMKVMFSEMGTLMSEMEPVVRTALSSIYAKKYSAKELADMNTFFSTPSGATFAGNFMATFTDKEMMQASFGMMPKMMEAMPAIIRKVEEATAHLPLLPKSEAEMTMEAAADSVTEMAAANSYAAETGEEPWYIEDNWTPANRKKATKLSKAFVNAAEKSEAASSIYDDAHNVAVDEARTRYLADGGKPAPAEQPVTTEAEPTS